MLREKGLQVLRGISNAKAVIIEKIDLAQTHLTKFGGELIEQLSQIEGHIKPLLEEGGERIVNSVQYLEYYSHIQISGCSLDMLTDKIQQYIIVNCGNANVNQESSSRKEMCKLLSELLHVESKANIVRNKDFKESLELSACKLINLVRSHVKILNREVFNTSINIISQDRNLNPEVRYKILDLQLELQFQALLEEKKIDLSKLNLNITDPSRRIAKELEIERYEVGIRIWHEGELNKLKALILGPLNTIYEGGVYLLDISLNQYPRYPPSVKFLTKVNHPNISYDGTFRLDILENRWTQDLNLNIALMSIQVFLGEVPDHNFC